MLSKKKCNGFKSIFRTKSYQEQQKSNTCETVMDWMVEGLDCTISDSGSSSDEIDQENGTSRLRISNYSSNESGNSDGKHESKNSLPNSKSIYVYLNSHKGANDSTAMLPAKRKYAAISPWSNVRNTFQALRYVNSKKNLNTFNRKEKNITDINLSNKASTQENLADRDNASVAFSHNFTVSTPSIISSQGTHTPAELDLFIPFIQDHCNSSKIRTATKKIGQSGSRHYGKYRIELQRTLAATKTDQKFLEYDKKFGLQKGIRLNVLKLDESFGVHMATVEPEHQQRQILMIILNAEFAQRLREGSKLEAFFEATSEPYAIIWQQNTAVLTYIQPHRLLLLEQ